MKRGLRITTTCDDCNARIVHEYPGHKYETRGMFETIKAATRSHGTYWRPRDGYKHSFTVATVTPVGW
jgi:hypothetical protein